MPRRSGLVVLAALVTLASREAQAAKIARFHLEHTITRQTHGPILNQPGYRFQIGTDGYIVVASKPGQVCFSTYPRTQYLGPYELEQDRIVDLGSQAYTIVRLDSIEQQEIPAHIPVHAPTVPPPPELPGTPPASEEIAAEPWTWNTAAWPVTAMVWAEPFRRTKYDWELGGYEGERASDLESTRLGGTLFWGRWSFTLGLTANAEHADSVIPANMVVSDLRLENGTGYLAALGYTHRIRLDRRWNAVLGGTLEYRGESFDLTATTLTAVEPPAAEPPAEGAEAEAAPVVEQPTHEYVEATSSADLTEFLLTLNGGIEYEADAWGTRLEILLSALDDTSVDASVVALGQTYELTGSRSHPVSIALTGWGYVLEGIRLEAQFSAGAETALRLGAAYEW